jgi:hypothetical protein
MFGVLSAQRHAHLMPCPFGPFQQLGLERGLGVGVGVAVYQAHFPWRVAHAAYEVEQVVLIGVGV